MTFALTWLADVLLAARLKVAQQPDWQSRGRREMGEVKGVICHHTAGPAHGNMPSLGLVTNGRPDLPGPLCQLALGRDGTFYVVAAGLANHAGPGVWQGLTTGNSNFIGIEAENMGVAGDPWPEVQLDAYARGVAAILDHIGAASIMCCGHKEYALPPGRKIDPSFDMSAFRKRIDAVMTGAAPPALIPASDDQGRTTLTRGTAGPLVADLQSKLNIHPGDGVFGPSTEAAVRSFQRSHPGLTPDGIVGPKTWAALAPPAIATPGP